MFATELRAGQTDNIRIFAAHGNQRIGWRLMANPVFKFVTYDTAKYPFARLFAEQVVHTPNLARFHESRLNGVSDSEQAYEASLATRRLVRQVTQRPWFFKLYRAFVLNEIASLFGLKMAYNWPPVFRVHLAGARSISAWHRDTEVTGRHDLIAVWVPFVDTFGANTIWIENKYGSRELTPVAVKYGQALMFDSGYLWHCSVANTTDVTRFSMDFRVSPKRTDVEQPDLGILSPRPPGYEKQLSRVKPGAQYDRVQKIVWDEAA
ncbi:MAG TPA: hypothetical protein VE961_14240 [Pyrinomonadaceae bacterium]|nr:hypothetical protein [Pyrinomonadaceae bacterium]